MSGVGSVPAVGYGAGILGPCLNRNLSVFTTSARSTTPSSLESQASKHFGE